jgi:hypothetical protein
MALPVYSTNFFRAAAATGGPTDVYTVPTGNVAVVKCITIVYGDIIVSGLDAWVQTEDLCKLARYTWAYTISTPFNYGGTALFYGTWVVLEGETMAVQTASGTCDIQASGYLLSTP